MSDITDPTCPASAGEAAQEQAAPAAELSTPGASLENFSVAEPENALPRATLETLPETIAAACGRAGWTSLMPVQSLALPYLLEGRDIVPCSERQMRAVRGPQAAMLFQDPKTSLNPTMKV